MKINFPHERVNNYAVYEILNDEGELIISLHGPMSAVAAEVMARYLESNWDKPINVHDIFDRHRKQENIEE